MKRSTVLRAVLAAAFALSASAAQAVTEIQWWHSMTGALNDRVNELAKGFNESQNQYKVVPVYKGAYPESMAAAISAPATLRTSCRCSKSAPRP
jgi:sn-glycerol 3-phosphate transport system substrate-binding protein